MKILRSLVFARHDPTAPPDEQLKPDQRRTGNPFLADELRKTYGKCIVGTNAYFGINSVNKRMQGYDYNTAPQIESWLKQVQPGEEFTLMLGIEPNVYDEGFKLSNTKPFDYVSANLDIVGLLGERLAGAMGRCKEAGATMRCVVRYASEMNKGTGNGYSGNPEGFLRTYAQVHGILKAANPEILFSFSPGMGSIDVSDVDLYWPGSALVDLVGCTWYFNGGAALRQKSKDHLDAYLRKYATPKRPVCIDELAGSTKKNDPNVINEASFMNMRDHLHNLDIKGVDVEHVTYFLADVWGRGVDLRFAC